MAAGLIAVGRTDLWMDRPLFMLALTLTAATLRAKQASHLSLGCLERRHRVY